MDSQTISRLKDLLSQSQKIIVAVGENPGIDDMGAGLALFLSLQNMGKTVSIVSPTEPIVEIANLVGIDQVKTRLEEGSGGDLIVSFPYKEGEIEKVSYTIENGFLNIVVKAGEDGFNFDEQEVKYTKGGGSQPALLFTVGIADLVTVQDVIPEDILKNVTIVNIDNKAENQSYGDIALVSNRASSLSEQVTHLLQLLQINIAIDAAQNLMDGMTYATDNFQMPQTNYLTFEMAGILLRQGASRTVVKNRFENQPKPMQPALPQMPAPVSRSEQNVRAQQPMQQDQQRQQQRQNQMPQTSMQRSPDRKPFMGRRDQHPMPRPLPRPQQNARVQQPMIQPVPSRQQVQSQQMDTNQPQVATPVAEPQESLTPPSDWLTPKVYKGSTSV